MLFTRSKRLTQKKMFSIIELLGVIAIMSIITAIVVAALKPDPLKSTTRRISGVLAKARSYALSNRTYVRVEFEKMPGGNFEIQSMKSFDGVAAVVSKIVPGSIATIVPKTTALSSDTTGNLFIVFSPSGGTSPTPALAGSDLLGEAKGKYYITISDRRGSGQFSRVYINKFTGTASVDN